MNNLEGLIEEINIDKEILGTLPQNNKKNKKIYSDKIEELSQKYNAYEEEILKEIEKRSKKYDGLKFSDELKKSDEELEKFEKVLYLLSEEDTPFEKMDLDMEILNLTFYYRKSLRKVNDAILYCINKIKETGVEISEKDFIFNKYVNEYISELLKNESPDKLNSKFEQIYWKCPEIITYIELNIRYIYFKNEKKLIKYYKDKKEELLRSFQGEALRESYLKIKQENIEAHKEEKLLIVEKFLDGQLQVKDYDKDAIIGIIKNITTKKDLDTISDDELNNIILNLINFLNTIREYRNYNEFKFIIDDVKKIYNEKKNYKAEYTKLRKEINSLENKIIKLNKTGLFNKSEEKNQTEQTKLVQELKEKYKDLDVNEVSSKIVATLNDHSTLYDALKIASLYYKYLFRCLIEKDKDIQEEEINDTILKIREFLNWPYFILLNNIEINEDKDIMLIIKDRYNLLNLNISREDLDIDNLDSMIKNLEKCELYYYIQKNKINLRELSETYEFKKILEK